MQVQVSSEEVNPEGQLEVCSPPQKSYPIEFRRDVVQVARNREPGGSAGKIGADCGIHQIVLSTWLKKVDIEDGVKPGVTSAKSA